MNFKLSSLLLFSVGIFAFSSLKIKLDELPQIKVPVNRIIPQMEADEFRNTVPMVLPYDNSYSGKGFEKKSYHSIEGGWNYEFAKNILVRAVFNWYRMLDYDDLNEGKSYTAMVEFKKFHTSSTAILKMLTEKYGEPKGLTIADTANTKINYDSYTNDFITAYWDNYGVTINFRAWYDGRERPDPMQNIINGPGEMYAFRTTIEVMGVEEKQNLHFRLGETAQEMEKRDATIFKNGTGLYGNFTMEENFHGMEGTWNFCFKNNLLQNAGFTYYFSDWGGEKLEFNEKNYSVMMENIRKTKKDFVLKFGEATTGYDSIPAFKELEKRIQNNDFLNYEWKLDDRIIRMELDYFYGGKGEYHQSVSFNIYIMGLDGKYSYCD